MRGAPLVVDILHRDGHTPLHAAVKAQHAEVARVIYKAGGRLKWDSSTAAAEMCEAAKSGNADKLNLLVSCGCKINAHDYDHRTALHLAASVGNWPIAQHLLECGAHINQKDRWGGTAAWRLERSTSSALAC